MTRIDGLHNFRDTGGIPLAGGGVTRAGVLWRSDALGAVTDTGLHALAATSIGVVVDLRTSEERAATPDRLPLEREFRLVELSILEGNMAGLAQQFLGGGASADELARATALIPTLDELYAGMLAHGASAFAEIARLVAASRDDAPTAVLVHCTAGKDRTGVATALLLDAVGADRDAIIADYASSQENLAGKWAEGMLHMIGSLGVPLTPQLTTLVTGTPPEAIATTLTRIDDTYGGAAAYLRSGGLTDAELDRLRERLSA